VLEVFAPVDRMLREPAGGRKGQLVQLSGVRECAADFRIRWRGWLRLPAAISAAF
jgi:hypothetical protein